MTTLRRGTRAGLVGLALATTMTVAGAGGVAQARSGESGTDQSQGQSQGQSRGHAATQRAVDAMVAAGMPGVTVQARNGNAVWESTSGVGNRTTGAPRGTDDRFRIASITKTFVATVLLQMEAEGRLSLDDTVERHLPGTVRGNGHDGRTITLRQLLSHTSGIYNYDSDPAYQQKYMLAAGFLKHRYDTRTPEEAVRVAMTHPPYAAPGTQWNYSNTNYVLAGMIIEKVGGKTYEEEVRGRIVTPLGLRATTLPGNSSHLPKPSSRAYSKLSLDPAATRIYDVTLNNGSQLWADGDIISTTGDLNRFFSALLRGKLLPPKQLASMKTTVPMHPDAPSYGYGLGLITFTTSCGTKVWGHSGGWLGSFSNAFTTEDGRHGLAYNSNGDWVNEDQVAEAEFCGVDPTTKAGTGPAAATAAATATRTVPGNRG